MNWEKILTALPKWVFMFLAVTISIVIVYAMTADKKIYLFGLEVGPEESSSGSIPVGTIVAYWGKVAPKGWLICDGEPIDDKHTELRKISGNNTPNLRGYFLRGLDPKGIVDPDGKSRSIGHKQNDQFQSHRHFRNEEEREEYTRMFPKGTRGFQNMKWDWDAVKNKLTGKPIDGNYGNETRPKNVAVNYIIKY